MSHPYMTTREVADALSVTPMTVSRMARDGRLTPVHPGAKARVFRRREVERLAERRSA